MDNNPTRPGPHATVRELYEYASWLTREQHDYGAWTDTFAVDGVMELPFPRPEAIPRRLEGREEIRRILGKAQQSSVDLYDRETVSHVLHETTDPEVLFAELELVRIDRNTGKRYPATYVHRVTVKNGEFVHFKDYANYAQMPPSVHSHFDDSGDSQQDSAEASRSLANRWLAAQSLGGEPDPDIFSESAHTWHNHDDARRRVSGVSVIAVLREVAPDFQPTEASVYAWPGGFTIDLVWAGTTIDGTAVRAPAAFVGHVQHGRVVFLKEWIDPDDLAPLVKGIGEERVAGLRAAIPAIDGDGAP